MPFVHDIVRIDSATSLVLAGSNLGFVHCATQNAGFRAATSLLTSHTMQYAVGGTEFGLLVARPQSGLERFGLAFSFRFIGVLVCGNVKGLGFIEALESIIQAVHLSRLSGSSCI